MKAITLTHARSGQEILVNVDQITFLKPLRIEKNLYTEVHFNDNMIEVKETTKQVHDLMFNPI